MRVSFAHYAVYALEEATPVPDSKRTRRRTSSTPGRSKRTTIRDGGTPLVVQNSGLEVWLYDEANLEAIRATNAPGVGFGGMPGGFDKLTRKGVVVGYSLCQDDELNVVVHVGPPFTDGELSIARWLEPQRAFLRLPSGRLCVESNDASRIGPETPGTRGAVVDVPSGNYGVLLYRIDHEALGRERMQWTGPEEVIVLSPGGDPKAAAKDLLPFEPRRDNEWIGTYTVRGRSADALAWFSDYWDTCVVNLDRAAVTALGLVRGSYIRIDVPIAGISLVAVFAESWEDGRRLPPPAGVALDDYAYAVFSQMGEWENAEALFCRRDRAKTRVEDEHQNLWIAATVEVLDVEPQSPPTAEQGRRETDLRTKVYFDSGFLCFILSDVLPGVDDLEELELSDAVDMLDRTFAKFGLEPLGDVAWTQQSGAVRSEVTCRFYGGQDDCFATILAREGCFEVFFVSEFEDETWNVTGLADEIARRVMSKGPNGLPRPHPRVRLESMDESLSKIFKSHRSLLKKAKGTVRAAPTSLDDAVAAWERFAIVAFGPLPS